MTTIIYFIMACSFAMGTYTTVGIIWMALSIWGIGLVSFKGWAIWFISWLTVLVCLLQLGYIT